MLFKAPVKILVHETINTNLSEALFQKQYYRVRVLE